MIDRRMLGLALMIVMTSGCPGPGATAPVPLESLPSELAGAECAFFARCGTSLDVFEQFVLHEQITDCEAQLGSYLGASALGPIRAGVADGTIVYHADLGAACIDSLAVATCESATGATVCTDVFEGTLADGAECSNSEQCSSTSACDHSLPGMCPSGVCAHVPQSGESCTTACAGGFRCSGGTCGPLGTTGDACSLSGSVECEPGLSCLTTPADPSHGTCGTSTPAALGEPCVHGCAAGLVCSRASLTCRQPLTDGSCEVPFSGASDCAGGQECIAAPDAAFGTCEALPSAGDTCSTICARGSSCVAGTCIVRLAEGSACETDTACLSGYCSAGVCAAAPLCRPS